LDLGVFDIKDTKDALDPKDSKDTPQFDIKAPAKAKEILIKTRMEQEPESLEEATEESEQNSPKNLIQEIDDEPTSPELK
jgi:hypothetical protein